MIEARVEIDTNGGCWLWSGSTVRRGYGGMVVGGKSRQVHRVSYAVHVGDPGSSWVLHRCDVPACCNPAHLFLGDARSNVTDRAVKGRSSGGRNGGRRRLSAEQVADIRAHRAADTLSAADLAAKYGVNRDHINGIAKGSKWKTQ